MIKALQRFRHSGEAARPHGWTSRLVHLAGALLVLYGLATPAEFEDLFDPSRLWRETMFALVLGFFFLARFLWIALKGGGSRLPSDAPRWERRLSRIVHHGVYVAVLGVVATGLVIAYLARGLPDNGFSPESRILGLHEAFASLLNLCVFLHISGALWHWLVRRDGVWESMVGTMPRLR